MGRCAFFLWDAWASSVATPSVDLRVYVAEIKVEIPASGTNPTTWNLLKFAQMIQVNGLSPDQSIFDPSFVQDQGSVFNHFRGAAVSERTVESSKTYELTECLVFRVVNLDEATQNWALTTSHWNSSMRVFSIS